VEFGSYDVFQFNGKDLFVQNDKGEFRVLSFCEIPSELHKHLHAGKKLEISKEEAPQTGTYIVKDINLIGFHLGCEDLSSHVGLLREYVLESAESRKTVYEYQIRPSSVVQQLKLGVEVTIDGAGLYKIPEKEAAKPQGDDMRREQITKSIAGLEAQKILPLYARNKLKLLRKELESYRFNEPRKGYTVWSYYDE